MLQSMPSGVRGSKHGKSSKPLHQRLAIRPKRTIGEWISIVAEAIRDGRVPNISFGKLQDSLIENNVFIKQ